VETILAFVLAGLGVASWRHGRRKRQARLAEGAFDPDAHVVFHVANHEARARNQAVSPLHLIYGLLQDETFTQAIARLGGDALAIEHRVHAELDRGAGELYEAQAVVARAYGIARHHDRSATAADVWQAVSRTDAAAIVELAPVTRAALSFALVHGVVEGPAQLAGETAVHVVLRNDDYTTQDIVVAILRDVFGLAEAEAMRVMLATHTEGKAIVGRFAAAAARDKVEAARARARASGFPLWVGVEPC
jgi:ATP-dependent Clp protease adaptor protein ClpS